MTIYQYPDYMYHYGVKGMKWGVRKRTGVTKGGQNISKRRLKKDSKKVKSTPNYDKVSAKMNKEFNATPEAKKHLSNLRSYAKLQNELYRQTGSRNLVLGEETGRRMKADQAAADAKGKEIYNRYKDQIAGATLKDLGYDDTKSGRDYLKRKGFV